ncbi:2'-5' RNA ligase family protein [Paraflavisolibacter sp. H34]|uniref:2'-5' RNA ligase family protein n=1 Tax=Huijunlia imazamoxiresistens TaxID=3127457 RepID=UPI00301AB1C0
MNMYFLAVVLPEELNEEILEWKRHMYEKYKCCVGLKSPAHITIVPPFWMEANKEEQLLSDVDVISKDVPPFPMATRNFSAFRPRTIFVDVRPSDELDRLKKAADDFFRENEFYNIKVETRPFHPHITIATRDLFKKDFFEAWPYFEQKQFEREWTAAGLSVLRHNTKNWDVIYTARFE